MQVLVFNIKPGVTAIMNSNRQIQFYSGKVDMQFSGANTVTAYLVGMFHGVKVWLVVAESRKLLPE